MDTTHISDWKLKSDRNWTRNAIAKYLPPPVIINGRKMFLVSDVEKAEALQSFQDWMSIRKRSQRAKRNTSEDLRYITLYEDPGKPLYAAAFIPTPDKKRRVTSKSYAKCGGKKHALKELRVARDRLYKEVWGEPIPPFSSRSASVGLPLLRPTSDNGTGKGGVSTKRGRSGEVEGFIAAWTVANPEGRRKRRTRSFSFDGKTKAHVLSAFIKACGHRDKQMGVPVLTDFEYQQLFNAGCLPESLVQAFNHHETS